MWIWILSKMKKCFSIDGLGTNLIEGGLLVLFMWIHLYLCIDLMILLLNHDWYKNPHISSSHLGRGITNWSPNDIRKPRWYHISVSVEIPVVTWKATILVDSVALLITIWLNSHTLGKSVLTGHRSENPSWLCPVSFHLSKNPLVRPHVNLLPQRPHKPSYMVIQVMINH